MMKWTKKNPTTNGFFWARDKENHNIRTIIPVELGANGEPIFGVGFYDDYDFVNISDCEWSDTPIPEPTE